MPRRAIACLSTVRNAAPDSEKPNAAVRHHAGGVVDERDEQRRAALAPVGDLRSVHDICHPQRPGIAIAEAAPIRARGQPGGRRQRPGAGQQPVHGGRRQRLLDPRLAGGLDDLAHGAGGFVALQLNQPFGHRVGQHPDLATVGAPLRVQRLEAALAVAVQPFAYRLRRDPLTARAGDGVGARGLVLKPCAQAAVAARQVHQVGDQPVTEQRDLLAEVLVRGVHGFGPAR